MSDELANTAEVEAADEIGIDPVCGAAIDLEIAAQGGLIVEFADREYAFCGRDCRDRFTARPAAFAVAGRSEP